MGNAKIRVRNLPLTRLMAVVVASSPAMAKDGPAKPDISNEIIVTAQKREERLKDVPVPVSAIGGNALLAVNQTRAQDFFSSMPGVNLQFVNNRAQLAIRGITTGPATGNPAVGFTIDDVPYGSSTGQGGLFGAAPDIDPSELARIEVLRGPQGTLYGASSIGGLVKYVTVAPDTRGFSGSVGGGLNMVNYGGQSLGYNARAALNIPLSQDTAIRASVFTRRDAGYIDNIRTGRDNVNSSNVTGGRLSALWKPSSSFSLRLSALYQVRDLHGSPSVDGRTGAPFQQTDQIGAGPSHSEVQMYNATIKARLGEVDLTSVTAFSRNSNSDRIDFTASPLTLAVFPVVYPAAPDFGHVMMTGYSVDKVSHETRLSGTLAQSFDWIAGGFYTREKANYTIDSAATNPLNGAIYGYPVVWRDSATYEEFAGFANITARLSERFDVQLGGRWSRNTQSMIHREWTMLAPDPAPAAHRETNPQASGNAFTFQVSPRFKPTSDHMIYGRVASGYRPGGPNAGCNTDPAEPVPCQFKPDRTINYELGAKGDLLNRALSYDISLFAIDWRDIQVTQVSALGTFTYNSNGGKARSRGLEISLEARPTDRLTAKMWWSYVDATLRQGFASAVLYAAPGDRLPYSSEHSGRFSLDYEAPLRDGMKARLGLSATYVGDRKGEFVPSQAEAPLRQTYPGYVQFDINGGLSFGKWNANAFVQNLTDKRGLIGGGYYNQTNFNRYWFNLIAPRTVGLSLDYSF
ncbi:MULTISPECIES: TonB-dependent receptor [unclassified Novosphingobium]|uniref:TonB-dependent receptor n=2 Tax=Novosphingobium TaxID=165696 RepID=UPI00086A1344|nr:MULTISPECIES: TonB-dependent receptor [unclassified Novosphingobium]ODU79056.1 MAG: hypothetical protein ABT10_21350 [Novosphingobium sp. SCN 63-17]OJX96272.1 MAG: hypothetical protein BGP00_16915 [Novosphingobium sp. 63-713]